MAPFANPTLSLLECGKALPNLEARIQRKHRSQRLELAWPLCGVILTRCQGPNSAERSPSQTMHLMNRRIPKFRRRDHVEIMTVQSRRRVVVANPRDKDRFVATPPRLLPTLRAHRAGEPSALLRPIDRYV